MTITNDRLRDMAEQLAPDMEAALARIEPKLLSPEELKAIQITKAPNLSMLHNPQPLPCPTIMMPDLYGEETIKKLLGHIAALDERLRKEEEHKNLKALLNVQEQTEEDDDTVLLWIRQGIRVGRYDSSLKEIVVDDGRTAAEILRDVRAAIGYQTPQEGGEGE